MSHKVKAVARAPPQGQKPVNPTALERPIDSYEKIAEFLAGCRSPFTAKGYKTALNKFFNYAAIESPGVDPDAAVSMKPEQLNPLVLKYAMHLKKVAKTTGDFKRGEISANSVMFYLSPIKKYFDYNEITLSWKKIMRFVPEQTVKQYHVYSKEEIKKLLAVANPRERAIILILESTGMRAQALVKLQIRDFEVLADNIGHFVVYARTTEYYHTFCTPECTTAIKLYLDWRKEMGEVEKGQELNPEAPLIRDNIREAFSKSTKNPSPISYMRLWEIMQKLLRKANIPIANIQPNHSFRKFMNTVIANAKANPLFKEIMLGHSIKLDNLYYDRADPASLEALKQEYIKGIDVLTINDEYRLKIENENLKAEIANLAPKDAVKHLSMTIAKMEEDNKRRDAMWAEWMKGKIVPESSPQG